MALLRKASRSTRALSFPAGSRCCSNRILASVRVPVLSVHNTSIAPMSWIADRRLTMTCLRAMRSAPRDSVTDTIIGSSSGVSPTASATPNRNDSSRGRWNIALTRMVNNTSNSVSRMISSPKRRVPISKAVGGGRFSRSWAMRPIAVALAVRNTRTCAEPLTTLLPMNTWPSVSVSMRSTSTGAVAAWRSTGKASPVSSAWLTKKSCASRTCASAGTRSPADSNTTSPGTSCSAGISARAPSRSTLTFSATCCDSCSAAWPARYSCTKSSTTLSSTITAITAALVASPVAAEIAQATSSTITSGLPKRARNCSATLRRCGFSTLGPKRASRAAASLPVRPAADSDTVPAILSIRA